MTSSDEDLDSHGREIPRLGVLTDMVGRSETRQDLMSAVPVLALDATLDRAGSAAGPGAPLPPLRHWLYFLPRCAQRDLGVDGHCMADGLTAAACLPRRMWAASELQFSSEPIRLDDTVERVSTIAAVKAKNGRTGRLLFVTVLHELRRKGDPLPSIVERQTIVYRPARIGDDLEPAPQAPPTDADSSRSVELSEVLLFRYSALTFNSHRIHYDRPYATAAEGYQGLVVHGPLLATLLMDLARDHELDGNLATFGFKAIRPVIAPNVITVFARRASTAIKLWAIDPDGWLAMEAVATIRK